MAEHVTLTDPYVHEPKGITSAATNSVYVADGAGSGSWETDFLNTSTIYLHGWWDYNDDSGSQSYTASTFTDLANDGAGSFTTDTYKIPGAGDIWDTANNQFDWDAAGCQLGDTVDIRFDIDVTTSSANQVIRQYMDLAHGDAGEYQLQTDGRIVKSTGTININVWFSVYMGDTTTLNNPAKWVLWSDANANYTVNGVYVRHNPRNPVIA